MKKITLLLIIFAGFFMFGKPFVASGEPTRELIDVTVETYFSDDDSSIVIETEYGRSIAFDSNLTANEEYEFAFWIWNGVVRKDLPVNHEFMVRSHTHLRAVFTKLESDEEPTLPEVAHAFMDVNGQLLNIQFLPQGVGVPVDPTTLISEMPTKPNYVVRSNPNTWDKPLAAASENTIYTLQYEINPAATFDLIVNGGTGSQEDVQYNSVITVVADEPEVGEYFTGWYEGDVLVSYEESYTFTVLGNRTLTATFGETEVVKAPLISLSRDLELRPGTHQSFLAQFSLAEGYKLIEYGLVVADSLKDLTLNNADDKFVGRIYSSYSKEYLISLTNNYTMIQAYLVVENSLGELEYYYSNNNYNTDGFVTVTDIWASELSTSHLDFTPFNVIGVVAATTDRGYILQDTITAEMISVHSTTTYSKGDMVALSGDYNLSFNIGRIVNVRGSRLVSTGNSINFSTDNAIAINWDSFSVVDYVGKLVELQAPWGRLAGTTDTSYLRFAHLSTNLTTQIYDGKYIGIQLGAQNANLTGNLVDYFIGSLNDNVKYTNISTYIFAYDSTSSYNKFVIIGDDHIIDTEDTFEISLSTDQVGAIVSITPEKAEYDFYELVAISATEVVGGYEFSHWYNLDNDTIYTTERVISFRVQANLNLKAIYTELIISSYVLKYAYDFNTGNTTVIGTSYDSTLFTAKNQVNDIFNSIARHRTAANTAAVLGATRALIIAPRSDSADPKNTAYVMFNFGTDTITKLEFDAYYWNSAAKSAITSAVLEVKNGDNWVQISDLVQEIADSLTINTLVFEGFSGTEFRILVNGGGANNDARFVVDNLKAFGNS